MVLTDSFLLLKAEVNLSKKKKYIFQNYMHEPAASRGPKHSSIYIGRMLQVKLKEKAIK